MRKNLVFGPALSRLSANDSVVPFPKQTSLRVFQSLINAEPWLLAPHGLRKAHQSSKGWCLLWDSPLPPFLRRPGKPGILKCRPRSQDFGMLEEKIRQASCLIWANKLHSRPKLWCPAPAGDEASCKGYFCVSLDGSLELGEHNPQVCFFNNFVEIVHSFEAFMPVVFIELCNQHR